MTTLTKERRDAIRAAAEKATPGPWMTDDSWIVCTSDDATYLASTNDLDTHGRQSDFDAAHIANCDPQTILALLDALATLTARVAELERNEWPFGTRPNPVMGHTFGDFAVYGGEKSIKRVRAAMHEHDAMMPARIERINQEKARADAAEARLAKVVEALTPSGGTKAAYIGEFSFMIDEVVTSEDGDEVENRREVTVPWTTVKEIMAAIRARAALSELEG